MTLQLFDVLDPATEAALRASIERFGVLAPIHVSIGPWKPGAVIDGHHRSRLAREVRVHCPKVELAVRDQEHAEALQRTLNTDRRHLDPETRRQHVAELRREGHSERAIAGALGVSQPTVHEDIKRATEKGLSVQPESIRGRDGKVRPATRSGPTPALDADDPLFAPGEIDAIRDTVTQALADEHEGDIPEDVLDDALDEAVTGNVESKQVPEPKPDWLPSKPDLGEGISHPARFSEPLLAVFRELLNAYSPGTLVLDPFAGTGKIHELRPQWETWGIEIEPEWAQLSEWTREGSALALPWDDNTFDAIVTSPTYGNRLADHHNASDPERRRSYTHDLGRDLHPDNSGAMQWGDRYRRFHRDAWVEAKRVLKPGGVFLLNIKDHNRDGRRQHVAGWHVTKLARIGCSLLTHRALDTGSLRQGANSSLRLPEMIYVLTRDDLRPES